MWGRTLRTRSGSCCPTTSSDNATPGGAAYAGTGIAFKVRPVEAFPRGGLHQFAAGNSRKTEYEGNDPWQESGKVFIHGWMRRSRQQRPTSSTTRRGSTPTIEASGFIMGSTLQFQVLHVIDRGAGVLYGTRDDVLDDNSGEGHEAWYVTDSVRIVLPGADGRRSGSSLQTHEQPYRCSDHRRGRRVSARVQAHRKGSDVHSQDDTTTALRPNDSVAERDAEVQWLCGCELHRAVRGDDGRTVEELPAISRGNLVNARLNE